MNLAYYWETLYNLAEIFLDIRYLWPFYFFQVHHCHWMFFTGWINVAHFSWQNLCHSRNFRWNMDYHKSTTHAHQFLSRAEFQSETIIHSQDKKNFSNFNNHWSVFHALPLFQAQLSLWTLHLFVFLFYWIRCDPKQHDLQHDCTAFNWLPDHDCKKSLHKKKSWLQL